MVWVGNPSIWENAKISLRLRFDCLGQTCRAGDAGYGVLQDQQACSCKHGHQEGKQAWSTTWDTLINHLNGTQNYIKI